MGITVTRPDGERLSYGEALERTAAVWLYGAGLGISIVELVCNYRSYRRYTNGEELAWEERQHRALRRARHGKDGAALRGDCWAVRVHADRRYGACAPCCRRTAAT